VTFIGRNKGGKMSEDLLKELWNKGIAYLLQEYT
jgi:hypothetical protein